MGQLLTVSPIQGNYSGLHRKKNNLVQNESYQVIFLNYSFVLIAWGQGFSAYSLRQRRLMSSSVLPLVSGTRRHTKRAARRQMVP